MNNIWLIFKRDLRKIATNSMAIILAAGVLVLPSLYAWVNIYANWDPYGKQSTGNMKIAVMIEDKGISFRDIDINIGDQIEENLKANDVIDWQFLSKEDGIRGVKAGDYYAAIEIPENFSESLASIVTDHFEPPKITYYANEKKNAIATKITDKVVQTVQGEVNETFIKTIADVISKVMGAVMPAQGADPATAESLVGDIELAKNSLEGLKETIDGLQSVMALVKSVADAVPDEDVKKLFTDLNATVTNTEDAVKVTRVSVNSMTASVDSILSASSSQLADAAEKLGGIGNLLSTAAASHLKSASSTVKANAQNLSVLLTSLEAVQDALPGGVGGLDDLIGRIRSVQADLTAADGDIASAMNGRAANLASHGISEKLSSISGTLASISTDYNGKVKPALDAAVDSLLSVLEDLSGILSAVNGSGELSELAAAVNRSADNGTDILKNLSTLLGGFITRLDRFAGLMGGMTDSESVNIFYNLMVSNGDELGSFLASPVNVDTDTVYGIENYGSAMAPFYTTLAIWVGGIILIAIFKTDVKKKKEIGSVTPTQEYFGRALTFAAFALVQGLIVCLGDLLFLKIQCRHPLLFLLAGLLASLVYSFFIYSIVAAFGDIGKAIVVILLVVQLGGSGGTFPIDVTPAFFRAVNPYLPFTFVIDAMRECVCDTWGADYWIDLLKLCAYVLVALVLGLLVRRVFRKPVRFFTKKIDETGLL